MTCGLFGSRSLLVHIGRGAAGIGLIAWALLNQAHPVLAIAAFVAAVVIMRGCPACWTIGLVETIMAKLKSPLLK